MPLRQGSQKEHRINSDNLSHRESRIGLRALFSRSKTSGQDARASIVDFSSWSNLYSPKTDAALAKNAKIPLSLSTAPREQSLSPSSPVVASPTLQAQLTTAAEPAKPALLGTPSTTKAKKPNAPLRTRTPGSSNRPVRGSLATWDPPPLFQAYPQAVKHAQLPICTTSIEVLMRLQAATNGSAAAAAAAATATAATANASDTLDDRVAVAVAERSAEKPKRRHRRNTSASSIKLEWVSKIYVLVTSGYLLQYSAEGSFDRLPEKILPISRDSAAFASDLIPGRHWVLRVCASTDADGLQTADSRSIFYRLPFRGIERRHASTFLMVFEGAEEMESWISTLRREIEQLGGKKHLSETGKPKIEQAAVDPRFQVSQRTLVVRDPERFSRILSPGDMASAIRSPPPLSSSQIAQLHSGQHLEAPSPLAEREPMSDDMSMTNSVYSHDGRQLESLRDSAGNRFSYISTSQRTVVTSESSSPPCSPVQDSFAGNTAGDEKPEQNEATATAKVTKATMSSEMAALSSPPLPESPEARPRPNAAAILERRQSMRMMASSQRMADMQLMPTQLPPQQPPPSEPLPRLPISSFSVTSPMTKPLPPPVPLRRESNFTLFDSVPTIPNFSVPHLASKRYSAVVAPSVPTMAAPATAPAPVQELQAQGEAPPRSQHLLVPPAMRNSRRRLPPPSLAFSRPLSVVADNTSPDAILPAGNNESGVSNALVDDSNLNSPGYGSDVPDTPALFASWKTPSKESTQTPPASSHLSHSSQLSQLSQLSHSSHPSLRRRSGSYSSLTRDRKSSNASTSSKITGSENPAGVSPRRYSSLLTLRSSGNELAPIETRMIDVPQRISMALPMSRYNNAHSPRLPDDEQNASAPRPSSRSSSHSQPRSRANSTTRPSVTPPTSSGSNRAFMAHRRPSEYKRASMFVQPSTTSFGNIYTSTTRNHATGNVLSGHGSQKTPLRPISLYQATDMSGKIGGSLDTGRGPGPLAPLPAHTTIMTSVVSRNPDLHGRPRSSSASKAMLSRRSMTQLAEGPPPAPPPTYALPPPPAPPPTCALPPLPHKASEVDLQRRVAQI